MWNPRTIDLDGVLKNILVLRKWKPQRGGSLFQATQWVINRLGQKAMARGISRGIRMK